MVVVVVVEVGPAGCLVGALVGMGAAILGVVEGAVVVGAVEIRDGVKGHQRLDTQERVS